MKRGRLRWVRAGERVIDPRDPDLSTIQALMRALDWRVEFEVVHAHTGTFADCECNIIRGDE